MHCAALLFAQQVRNEPTTLDGVYDQITAPSFPLTVGALTVWARVFYSSGEAGGHDVALTVWDMLNGEQVGDSHGHITLPARPERGHPSNDITINVVDAHIPHAGEYEFRLGLDGHALASVYLTVIGSASLN